MAANLQLVESMKLIPVAFPLLYKGEANKRIKAPLEDNKPAIANQFGELFFEDHNIIPAGEVFFKFLGPDWYNKNLHHFRNKHFCFSCYGSWLKISYKTV